jgi:hypothetical protein
MRCIFCSMFYQTTLCLVLEDSIIHCNNVICQCWNWSSFSCSTLHFIQCLSFIATLHTATLQHRNPAPARTFNDSYGVWGCNKKKCILLCLEKQYCLQEIKRKLKLACFINPLNVELNFICHLLALLEAHHILHISRIRVKHHDIKVWG